MGAARAGRRDAARSGWGLHVLADQRARLDRSGQPGPDTGSAGRRGPHDTTRERNRHGGRRASAGRPFGVGHRARAGPAAAARAARRPSRAQVGGRRVLERASTAHARRASKGGRHGLDAGQVAERGRRPGTDPSADPASVGRARPRQAQAPRAHRERQRQDSTRGLNATPSQRIKARAHELGFSAVGIARIEPLEAHARYQAWLAAGRHGDMSWLATERQSERRRDPALILPGVRSVVCVALCHEPSRDAELDRRLGRVARYAIGEDYHRVMRDKLAGLELEIETRLPGAWCLWYADTGAVLERAWAERAGLGWIGKHSGMLSTELGSWFVLAEILVDRELEPDRPLEREHCGTCSRCLDACPTRAIVAPYQVDVRRC